jgi:hypothetical protein
MDLDLSSVVSLLQQIHSELKAIRAELDLSQEHSFAHKVIEELTNIQLSIALNR